MSINQVSTIDTRYPAARCRILRGMCMMQARKRKDAGMRQAAIEWTGYAAYWHTRVMRPDLTVNECQDLVHAAASRREARRQAQAATPSLSTLVLS